MRGSASSIDVTFMASGLLFMASGLQNSLHIGCWQAQYLAGTRAGFMLVAGTVLGTWLGSSLWEAQYLEEGLAQVLVAGTVLGRGLGSSWWQVQYLANK